MLLDRNNMGQIKKLTKALGLYKLYVLKNSFSVFITKIQGTYLDKRFIAIFLRVLESLGLAGCKLWGQLV